MNKQKINLDTPQQVAARLNLIYDPLDLEPEYIQEMKWQFMKEFSDDVNAYCLEIHNGRFAVKCNGKLLENNKFYGL